MTPRRAAPGGFSLLEVLVSLAIFSFAALAMGRAVGENAVQNRRSDEHTGAVMAAARVLDELRLSQTQLLPASGEDAARQITVGSRTFDVYISYCEPATYCTTGSIRAIHCTVKLNGQSIYAVDTVFAELR